MVVGWVGLSILLRLLYSRARFISSNCNHVHDKLGGLSHGGREGGGTAGYSTPMDGHMMRIFALQGYSFQFFKEPSSSNSTSGCFLALGFRESEAQQ